MTILKNGTPTGYVDRNGKEIRTADRIKHVTDGTVYVIDKFGRAKSALGFIYTLGNQLHAVSVPLPNGSYTYKLNDWELTDEPAPKAPEGETVTPGDDAQNFAPDRVKDPRNEALKGKKRKGARNAEAQAVDEGVTVEEARRILTIQDFQDEDLCDELRDRGYRGEITKTKTIKI